MKIFLLNIVVLLLTRNHSKLHIVFFPPFQTFRPINNQGFLRSLRVIICVLWQTQAAANWQASVREMLCKFYEWQRRLVAWLSTCNFDLLGALHAGKVNGRNGREDEPNSVSFCGKSSADASTEIVSGALRESKIKRVKKILRKDRD